MEGSLTDNYDVLHLKKIRPTKDCIPERFTHGRFYPFNVLFTESWIKDRLQMELRTSWSTNVSPEHPKMCHF